MTGETPESNLQRITHIGRSFSMSHSNFSSTDLSGNTPCRLVAPPYPSYPDPAFIAASVAAQIISTDFDCHSVPKQKNTPRSNHTALVAPPSLALVNHFLDLILYNILIKSTSLTMSDIRPAITTVLRPNIATRAIQCADRELQEYLGAKKGNHNVFESLDESEKEMGNSWAMDTNLLWKHVRLRCMIYSSLGDMEEENILFTDWESATPSDPLLLSSEVAIFLTSLLEFLGEQILIIAGKSALNRINSNRMKTISIAASTPTSAGGNCLVNAGGGRVSLNDPNADIIPNFNNQEEEGEEVEEKGEEVEEEIEEEEEAADNYYYDHHGDVNDNDYHYHLGMVEPLIIVEPVDLENISFDESLGQLWIAWKECLRSSMTTFSHHPQSAESQEISNSSISHIDKNLKQNSPKNNIFSNDKFSSTSPYIDYLDLATVSKIQRLTNYHLNQIYAPKNYASNIPKVENTSFKIPYVNHSRPKSCVLPKAQFEHNLDLGRRPNLSKDNAEIKIVHELKLNRGVQENEASTSHDITQFSVDIKNIDYCPVSKKQRHKSSNLNDSEIQTITGNQTSTRLMNFAHKDDSTTPNMLHDIKKRDNTAKIDYQSEIINPQKVRNDIDKITKNKPSKRVSQPVKSAVSAAPNNINNNNNNSNNNNDNNINNNSNNNNNNNHHHHHHHHHHHNSSVRTKLCLFPQPNSSRLPQTVEKYNRPTSLPAHKARETDQVFHKTSSNTRSRSVSQRIEIRNKSMEPSLSDSNSDLGNITSKEYVASTISLIKPSKDSTSPARSVKEHRASNIADFAAAMQGVDIYNSDIDHSSGITQENQDTCTQVSPQNKLPYTSSNIPNSSMKSTGYESDGNISPVSLLNDDTTVNNGRSSPVSSVSSMDKSSDVESVFISCRSAPDSPFSAREVIREFNAFNNQQYKHAVQLSGSTFSQSKRSIHTSGSTSPSSLQKVKVTCTSEEDTLGKFDQLIQSDQTIQFTLTPQNVLGTSACDSSKRSIRTNSDTTPGLASLGSPSGTKFIAVQRNLTSTLPSENSPQHARMNTSFSHPGFQNSPTTLPEPRDARIEPNSSLSDFANFIRNTGPEPSTSTRRNTSSAVSYSTNHIPTVRPSRSQRKGSVPGRVRLQSRDAVAQRDGSINDLIDFVRSGPHENSSHQISREVASFRTPKDSIRSLIGGGGGGTGDCENKTKEASSLEPHFARDSQSVNSSITSQSALLTNSIKNRLSSLQTKNLSSNGGSVSGISPRGDNNHAPPKRIMRKVPDPYSLDWSDEENDEASFQKCVTKKESLTDFLRNTSPPTVHSPKMTNYFDNLATSKNTKINHGSSSIKSFFGRKSASPQSSTPSLMHAAKTSQVSVPYSSGHKSSIDLEPTQSTVPRSNRVQQKSYEPRAATYSSESRTDDLASFLMDNEPPLTANHQSPRPFIITSQKSETKTFQKMFNRRRTKILTRF